MTTSRRGFLRLLGAGTTTGMAMHLPIVAASRAIPFEPSWQDDGFIRLNRNENAYGPSPKLEEVVRSSSSIVNRYPVREHRSLLEEIAGANHAKPCQPKPATWPEKLIWSKHEHLQSFFN